MADSRGPPAAVGCPARRNLSSGQAARPDGREPAPPRSWSPPAALPQGPAARRPRRPGPDQTAEPVEPCRHRLDRHVRAPGPDTLGPEARHAPVVVP